MNKALSEFTAANLRKIAQACGSKLIGRKSEIIHALHENCSQMGLSNSNPIRLISIDPGIVNLGVTRVLAPPPGTGREHMSIVEKCYLDSIKINSKSTNRQFADATIRFLNQVVGPLAPPVDYVIIEHQRSRSSGGSSVLPAVLQANILEAMVFAILRSMYPQINVLSVSPKSVVNYWESKTTTESISEAADLKRAVDLKSMTAQQLETELGIKPAPNLGLKRTKKTYATAKGVRRKLVDAWINGGADIAFEPNTLAYLQSLKGKRDDVHDSLVQAITWIQWRNNMYRIWKDAESGVPITVPN